MLSCSPGFFGTMKYYCLMVKTREEEKFKKLLEKRLLHAGKKDIDIIFFKKKLRTSKNVEYESALFKSYVFLATKSLDLDSIWIVKRTEYFLRFLNSNRNIKPLYGQDLEYVEKLLTFGKTQGMSKAYFDENMRIIVTEGPLKGFSGKIYKVNRRQQRVTVLLEMFHNSIKFDLGYDLVKPSSGQKPEEPS